MLLLELNLKLLLESSNLIEHREKTATDIDLSPSHKWVKAEFPRFKMCEIKREHLEITGL